MKNSTVILFGAFFGLAAVLFPVSAAAAPAHESGTTFKDIEGKEWILLGAVAGNRDVITLDRQKLEADNMGGFFTVSFRDGQVSGMGAPNRYTGPYTAGANRTLTIGNLASTKMMALRELDYLRENEYFGFLSGVTRWDFQEGKLELYSSVNSGTSLIFTRK